MQRKLVFEMNILMNMYDWENSCELMFLAANATTVDTVVIAVETDVFG